MAITHYLTIDVEDWYQVCNLEQRFPKHSWEAQESKIVPMVTSLLDLLEQHGVKATFFIVGALAKAYPRLVRQISDLGHEVASHSYWHREVQNCSPREFEEDIILSKRTIEQAAGREVFGFRAPGFSIGKNELSALSLVEGAGYRYDSSVYGGSPRRI